MTSTRKKKPVVREVPRVEEAVRSEDHYKDIRDLLPRGGAGIAKIDDAIIDTDLDVIGDIKLIGRVYTIFFTEDGEKYVARPCMLQTEKWVPTKGQKVGFERQPIGVEEQFLYATLLV